MNEFLGRLRSFWTHLSSREQMLVGGAGGLIAVALIWALLIAPLLRMASNTEARVASADQELRVALALGRDLDDINLRLGDVERRIAESPSGNLRSALESIGDAAGIQVDSMEPQASPAHDAYRETKVEVGLKNVSLPQMVDYLERIEKAPQVLSIKALRVRTRGDDSALLDVTFMVSSFEKI